MTLGCVCAACGRAGTYRMSAAEQETLSEYEKKGRSMGPLARLFPDIPAWIRYGCLEPLSGGETWCPGCKKL